MTWNTKDTMELREEFVRLVNLESVMPGNMGGASEIEAPPIRFPSTSRSPPETLPFNSAASRPSKCDLTSLLQGRLLYRLLLGLSWGLLHGAGIHHQFGLRFRWLGLGPFFFRRWV